jgi:hypothetical protein
VTAQSSYKEVEKSLKYTYSIGLNKPFEEPILTADEARVLLGPVCTIYSTDERVFTSLAGKRHVLHVDIEMPERGRLNEAQKEAIRQFGDDPQKESLQFDPLPRWQPGELEAIHDHVQGERRDAERRKIEDAVKEHPETTGYYLCYFRQEPESILDGSGGAPITQREVHSEETFTPYEQEQADARANELERERYARNDFNVRIVARLAASLEDAKEGRFLDE